MKILLKETVQGVGRAGEVRLVPDGYARNFLIPRNLGVPATADEIQRLALRTAANRQASEAEEAELHRSADVLGDQRLSMVAKASEQGRLFGSIGSKQIIDAINTKFDLKLADDVLKLARPLSQVGDHQLHLKLGTKNVTLTLTITSTT